MATVAKERELFEGAGFGKSACVRAGIELFPIQPQTTAHTHSGQCMHVTLISVFTIEAPDLLEPKKFEAFRYVQFLVLF